MKQQEIARTADATLLATIFGDLRRALPLIHRKQCTSLVDETARIPSFPSRCSERTSPSRYHHPARFQLKPQSYAHLDQIWELADRTLLHSPGRIVLRQEVARTRTLDIRTSLESLLIEPSHRHQTPAGQSPREAGARTRQHDYTVCSAQIN